MYPYYSEINDIFAYFNPKKYKNINESLKNLMRIFEENFDFLQLEIFTLTFDIFIKSLSINEIFIFVNEKWENDKNQNLYTKLSRSIMFLCFKYFDGEKEDHDFKEVSNNSISKKDTISNTSKKISKEEYFMKINSNKKAKIEENSKITKEQRKFVYDYFSDIIPEDQNELLKILKKHLSEELIFENRIFFTLNNTFLLFVFYKVYFFTKTLTSPSIINTYTLLNLDNIYMNIYKDYETPENIFSNNCSVKKFIENTYELISKKDYDMDYNLDYYNNLEKYNDM